jgi:hypothetical protein
MAGCGSASSSTHADGGSGPPSPDSGRTQGSDSGTHADAGRHADAARTSGDSGIKLGTAITAPASTWTWVPFPDAVCGNGSATGIGINLTGDGTSRVLLYLEGGGACWSEQTCFTFATATYVSTGYGPTEFTAESTDLAYLAAPGGFFDRTAADNPFKDYSYVYVPYCTGDVHGGSNVVTYSSGTMHFAGYENIGAYLARLVPTFQDAGRVILAGSSAGGVGAALNWSRVQAAFGSVRVDVIDDSGTPMPDDAIGDAGVGLEDTWSSQWNLAAALPPACTSCKADLSTILGYFQTAFPTHRGALLSYLQDAVLPEFYGISTAQFTQGLGEDVGKYFAPSSNLKYFTYNGSGHVLFFTPTLTTAGTTVQEFITNMVNDDPSWGDVHP